MKETSSNILSNNAQRLAKTINKERDKLYKQLEDVKEQARRNATTRSGGSCLGLAQDLQRTVNTFSSRRLIEFQSLLQTLLNESIEENQRKMREQNNGVVTVDSRTQTLLDGITDEVLRQYMYLAYLSDNTLAGDKLLQAGQALMEQTVNQTYEKCYEQERAKIRAELEASRVAPETVDKVLSETKGTRKTYLNSSKCYRRNCRRKGAAKIAKNHNGRHQAARFRYR